MPTINKHTMRAILGYLDAASAEMPANHGYESGAAWNIRRARECLYQAVIVDVEVQPAEIAFAREHGIIALAAAQDALVDRDLARWTSTVRATAEATGNPPVNDNDALSAA